MELIFNFEILPYYKHYVRPIWEINNVILTPPHFVRNSQRIE